MDEAIRELSECPVSQDFLEPGAELRADPVKGIGYRIDCPFCGSFELDPITLNWLKALPQLVTFGRIPSRSRARQIAVLAHSIRRAALSGGRPILTSDTMTRILAEDRLPSIGEQRDNLLRWMDAETEPGRQYGIEYRTVGAIVGAASEGAFSVLLQGVIDQGYLEGHPHLASITFRGLERVEELNRARPSGFNAFMAMKFGDRELDDIVENYFKPAVRRTGFELYRLDDRPSAGLIDARLRNEIAQSRFLVVDQSHANLGAYWEAGYAEGLGKPVIYTCDRDVFDGRTEVPRPHFDTNHHLTIVWDRGLLQDAADLLTATIRFTVPEARQED